MQNISELLLARGTKFYNFGRMAIKYFLLGGIALAAVILLISQIGWGYWGLDYLVLGGSFGVVNFLMVIAYIGILVGLIGLTLYFAGLHYMGLGQIAKNTETKTVVPDELPEL